MFIDIHGHAVQEKTCPFPPTGRQLISTPDVLIGRYDQVGIERAGVFPYSPEEGTPAAEMEPRVDGEEAARRAGLVEELQSRVMDAFNDARLGDVTEVLCEGYDAQAACYVGRSYAESPEIDGRIYFTSSRPVGAGEFVPVRLTGTMDGDMTGEREE